MNDQMYLPPPQPFWFVSSELSADLLHAEIVTVNGLIDQHPELRSLFDVPKATVSQRKLCFALLAHRELLETLYELFAGRYEQPPSFGEEQSRALRSSDGLITSDAPEWTLELNRVVHALPYHLFNALPESLRHSGLSSEDSAQLSAVRGAAEALGTLEQIRKLIAAVLDQQLERLAERWPSSRSAAPSDQRPYQLRSLSLTRHASKRKRTRTADKRRAARDRLIAQIDDSSETIAEFLRKMDDREVKPQLTWEDWPDSWTEAYKNPRLRALIHKDKSRAISRAKARK
jgi:hypothetical protein